MKSFYIYVSLSIKYMLTNIFLGWRVCVRAKLLQPCPTLCNLVDCSPPGSSVRGILHARILEWVAMPSSRGSSPPRDRTWVFCSSCIGRRVFYIWDAKEAHYYDYTHPKWGQGKDWDPGMGLGCHRKLRSMLQHLVTHPWCWEGYAQFFCQGEGIPSALGKAKFSFPGR